ncbi:MAG TPA: FtsX-like permease family protein, partial [Longimicrobiales bacterium]|nr:FtsX-like permease family protein [Longimicrobiales bacterium]
GRQVVEAIAADPEAPRSTVVGIVGDVHNVSLVEPPMGTVYYAPLVGEGLDRRWLTRSMSYAVRASSEPLQLVAAVRDAVRELDPQLPVAAVETMEARMDRARARTVFTMTMLAVGALMGLVLGAVGLYGVVSYVTARRTREIGLRMALGAEASSVLGLVLKRGMVITGAGLLVGLVGAWGGTRFLQSLLYEVQATDPVTYGAVTGVLLAVSFLASFVPARRASRVDVVQALRTE